ncbi:hypothetical protein E9993_02720 [Labilibacter sediminis]|nr:hypothetical protein E9993_02720 [Labilibacter sediminis]
MKFTWGHGIIVFFIIFLTWIIGFVIFTLGENNDLVTKDYYRQGAEYSLQMNINKRSKLYKDSISISNNNNKVQLDFASSLCQNNLEKLVYFYRPSGKRDDLKVLVQAGSTTATINKEQLKKGRYKVSVKWEMDNKKYEIIKDFAVN